MIFFALMRQGNGGASLTQALEEKKQCGSQKLQALWGGKDLPSICAAQWLDQ